MALAYDSSDGKIDLDAVSRDPYKKYVGGTSPDDLHMETDFDHLANPGYAGAYCTYQWSLAIARDLFTRYRETESRRLRAGGEAGGELSREALQRQGIPGLACRRIEGLLLRGHLLFDVPPGANLETPAHPAQHFIAATLRFGAAHVALRRLLQVIGRDGALRVLQDLSRYHRFLLQLRLASHPTPSNPAYTMTETLCRNNPG